MLYPPTPSTLGVFDDGTGFLLPLELDELPPTTPDVPLLELLLDDELLPVEFIPPICLLPLFLSAMDALAACLASSICLDSSASSASWASFFILSISPFL